MERNRNSESRDDSGSRHWIEHWDGQDLSIPEPAWVPGEIDILLHPELAQYRPDGGGEQGAGGPAGRSASAHPEEPLSPDEAASRRTAPPPEPQAHVPSLEDSGFYYRSGKPIPPTHPDHGPMHLIPRQEDGSFAAYYYCSHQELADFDMPAPPPRRHRRDGFSTERQQQFVEHYRNTGSLSDAAHLTGISRSTAYNLINRADGAAFRDALAEAGKGVDTILEATAFERCIKGQEEIVYYQGRRVGVRWRYDNKLLMALLRVRKPLQYAPLSEIEGWLKRRGVEPPADVDGALDRLAAAEEEWGRRLPDERPPAPATEELIHPGTGRGTSQGLVEAAPGLAPEAAIASTSSTSSTSPDENAAIASTSSTSPDQPAGDRLAIASGSSTLGAEDPAIASNSSTLPPDAEGSGTVT
jgi:hypothetical protein